MRMDFPRPGAWMETFKQLMGFVLLGTVVYLMTFVSWQLLVPTVARLLIGAEFAVGMAWFAQFPVAVAASALLLAGYTIAIAINLARGRTYITCGCGLTGQADETLTRGLIWRNVALLGAVGACWLPTVASTTAPSP